MPSSPPILWQGLPLFLVQAASLVYTIAINNYLGSLGGDADLAAFAVINGYVVYLLDILCLSATCGLQPIASFNCGARRFDRLSELVKVSLGGTLAVLAVVCGLVIAFAEPISAFFIGDDPQLIELTASHFLPLLACAPFGFLAQVASAYFQAVGQERISILLGVCRYLLFAIPMIVVLAAVEGLTGVWWSQPPAGQRKQNPHPNPNRCSKRSKNLSRCGRRLAFGARIVHNVEHLLTRAYAHVEPLPLVTISIGLLGCGLNVGCLFLAQIYG